MIMMTMMMQTVAMVMILVVMIVITIDNFHSAFENLEMLYKGNFSSKTILFKKLRTNFENALTF